MFDDRALNGELADSVIRLAARLVDPNASSRSTAIACVARIEALARDERELVERLSFIILPAAKRMAKALPERRMAVLTATLGRVARLVSDLPPWSSHTNEPLHVVTSLARLYIVAAEGSALARATVRDFTQVLPALSVYCRPRATDLRFEMLRQFAALLSVSAPLFVARGAEDSRSRNDEPTSNIR